MSVIQSAILKGGAARLACLQADLRIQSGASGRASVRCVTLVPIHTTDGRILVTKTHLHSRCLRRNDFTCGLTQQVLALCHEQYSPSGSCGLLEVGKRSICRHPGRRDHTAGPGPGLGNTGSRGSRGSRPSARP